MQIVVDLDFSGPIWERQEPKIFESMFEDIRNELTQQAREHIIAVGYDNFKHPTGNWRDHIAIDRGLETDRIHDSDLIYGPWLEHGATGSWGAGFKGYQLWEKTFLWTERSAKRIVKPIVDRHVKKLGG